MITIYGFDPKHFSCAPCVNAKRFCEAKNIPYEFIAVSQDQEDPNNKSVSFNQPVINELVCRLKRESSNGLAMPQIFNGEVHIGGFSELRTYKFN